MIVSENNIIKELKCIISLLPIGIIIFLLMVYPDKALQKDVYGDYPTSNVIVKTIECSELFDSNPGKSFLLSFDLKARTPGKIQIYQENIGNRRYDFCCFVYATEEYQHYDVKITPVLVDSDIDDAYITFFSSWNSDIIPVVKNLEIHVLDL